MQNQVPSLCGVMAGKIWKFPMAHSTSTGWVSRATIFEVQNEGLAALHLELPSLLHHIVAGCHANPSCLKVQ